MADRTVSVKFKGQLHHVQVERQETVGDFCNRLQQVTGSEFATETVKLLPKGKHAGGIHEPIVLHKDRDVPTVSAGKQSCGCCVARVLRSTGCLTVRFQDRCVALRYQEHLHIPCKSSWHNSSAALGTFASITSLMCRHSSRRAVHASGKPSQRSSSSTSCKGAAGACQLRT
jgi:hypothetical protein